MSSDFRIVVAIDLKAGTNRLMTEAQRYALALNAVVDIIHVAPPDPDFVGYIKSGDPSEKTQDNLIRDSEAKALRDEHQQTQDLAAEQTAAAKPPPRQSHQTVPLMPKWSAALHFSRSTKMPLMCNVTATRSQ